MKLYATTTSERASKGQGGEWLDIKIEVTHPSGKREELATIKVRKEKNGFPWDEYTIKAYEPNSNYPIDFACGCSERAWTTIRSVKVEEGRRQKGVIHESDVIRNDDGDEVEQ